MALSFLTFFDPCNIDRATAFSLRLWEQTLCLEQSYICLFDLCMIVLAQTFRLLTLLFSLRLLEQTLCFEQLCSSLDSCYAAVYSSLCTQTNLRVTYSGQVLELTQRNKDSANRHIQMYFIKADQNSWVN
jgi:hypothetical protein